jgi:hypothetical protein
VSSDERLDLLEQAGGQSGFATFIVGETGMMARDAIGEQPPQFSQRCGMLRPGRRVIDATGNLANMSTTAQGRAGPKVVLESVAEFAEVMPETNKMPPIAATESRRKTSSGRCRIPQMHFQRMPIRLRSSFESVGITNASHD